MSAAALRWSEVEPLLRGPFACAGAAERAFELAAPGCGRLRVGRLVSGPAWPADFPPLDRLAALPEAPARPAGAEREAVLHAELPDGGRFALCAQANGRVRWVCDPAAWIRALLDERYVERWARPLPARIPLVNYARLPHALKGAAERLLASLPRGPERRAAFPEAPLDTLVEQLRGLCARLAGGARQAPLWPEGRRAAVTLTHDVDTAWILDEARGRLLREIVDLEAGLGFRGAFYLVASRVSPRRHRRALGLLREAGFEIGLHGWNHDAKLGFLSERAQERRLARARARLAGLGVEEIRTPWYWRSAPLFRVLARHFAYDSSVPAASDLYGTRTRTGCCSVLPYRAEGGLLELPLTLPPDTALAGPDPFAPALRAVGEILALGGVAVPILHPQPHQSGREERLADWGGFLRRLRERHGAALWSATPAALVRHYAGAVAGAAASPRPAS